MKKLLNYLTNKEEELMKRIHDFWLTWDIAIIFVLILIFIIGTIIYI